MPSDIIISHMYQKLWSDDVQFLRYGVQWMDGQTDGQTDRWKKRHIEVGAPPKKPRKKLKNIKSTLASFKKLSPFQRPVDKNSENNIFKAPANNLLFQILECNAGISFPHKIVFPEPGPDQYFGKYFQEIVEPVD